MRTTTMIGMTIPVTVVTKKMMRKTMTQDEFKEGKMLMTPELFQKLCMLASTASGEQLRECLGLCF